MEASSLAHSIYWRRKGLNITIHQKLQVSLGRLPKLIFTPDSVLSAQAGIPHIISHVIDINVLQATHLSHRREVGAMSLNRFPKTRPPPKNPAATQPAAWHSWMPEKRAAGLSSNVNLKFRWLFCSGGTLYLSTEIVLNSFTHLHFWLANFTIKDVESKEGVMEIMLWNDDIVRIKKDIVIIGYIQTFTAHLELKSCINTLSQSTHGIVFFPRTLRLYDLL